jgi:nucleotide-binding universal stress UspA family protein
MTINKILFPVDFSDASRYAGKQAAALARHFHSEIVALYVVAPLDPGFVPATPSLLVEAMERTKTSLDRFLAPDFRDLRVRRLLLEGDAAQEIVRTAREEHADLIVMPTHGYGAFRRFLLGSVTAKVLHDAECPVWTGAHLEEAPADELAIRSILCAIDLSPHSRHTACWAAQMATEFGAGLTLAHIAAGVDMYGPGGVYSHPQWREALVSGTREQIARLQQEMGTKAEVLVDCGDVPRLLRAAAEQTRADVLVIGRCPSSGRLRASAYGIIRESPVPVLSV